MEYSKVDSLVSAFLAGVKRSTGLTYAQPLPFQAHGPQISLASFVFEKQGTNYSRRCRDRSPSLQSDKISDSREVKRWIDKYLGIGEWVMDQSVAVIGSSSYFERRR